MSTDNREDYLINILRLTNGSDTVKTTDIAKYMNVAPASVTEMLKVLSKEGLVNYERYRGVSLTPEGIRAARSLRRKHHIMERFMIEVLNLSHEAAHDGACAFEHSMSDDAAVKMCRLIGTKVDSDCETCPDPCDDMMGMTPVSACLNDLDIGVDAYISHLKGNEDVTLKRLITMGLIPGRDITVQSRDASGVTTVRLGESTLVIDNAAASSVFVEMAE